MTVPRVLLRLCHPQWEGATDQQLELKLQGIITMCFMFQFYPESFLEDSLLCLSFLLSISVFVLLLREDETESLLLEWFIALFPFLSPFLES